MSRRVGAAMAIWAGIAGLWAIFIFGGHVEMCLGPLGVTPESCRAAMGLPPLTDVDRFMEGPGPLIVVVASGWILILLAAWTIRRRRRSAGQSEA